MELSRCLIKDCSRSRHITTILLTILSPVLRTVLSILSHFSSSSSSSLPGNLALLGKCMSNYRLQKKVMAPGCEPLAVQHMMEALQPHVYGQSLAGAGGGGFLYVLTKQPRMQKALQRILAKTEVSWTNSNVFRQS